MVRLFKLPEGWRRGILLGCISAFTVLGLSLVVTVIAAKSPHHPGGRILFRGNCDTAVRFNVGIHFFINVMSTVLLAASNYGMQCLSAPTRAEIDRSHRKRVWMDIGVMSLRNLRRIHWARSLLWLILGASSLPLHFFFNAVVYQSVYAFDYAVFSATEDMVSPNATTKDLGVSLLSNSSSTNHFATTAKEMYAMAVAGKLSRREPGDCMRDYAKTFQTTQGSLILITANTSGVPYSYGYDNLQGMMTSCNPHANPFAWVCGGSQRVCNEKSFCGQEVNQLDPADWRPFGSKVAYCLSEQPEQQCSVQFGLQLAIVVMACNLSKAIALLCTFLFVKENPLLTIGDAVASFLERGDETTAGMCLMNKNSISWWQHGSTILRCVSVKSPTVFWLFQRSRKRWHQVVSRARWWTCLVLYFVGIATISAFVGVSVDTSSAYQEPSTTLSTPIGTADPRMFYSTGHIDAPETALVTNAIYANVPQVALSLLYFSYNGLFTQFLFAREWDSFESQKKSLRVSCKPRGSQRATFLLQIPKRWALPLMVLSATAHWLFSESLFLVSVWFDHSALKAPDESGASRCLSQVPRVRYDDACGEAFFTTGWSPIAIMFSMIVTVFMLAFVITMGLRRFKNGGIPFVGTCSASISACCHLLGDDIVLAGEIRTSNHAESPANGTRSLDRHGKVVSSQFSSTTVALVAQRPRLGPDASLLPMQWGVVERVASTYGGGHHGGPNLASPAQAEIKYCGFSTGKVGRPTEGDLFYGGVYQGLEPY